MSVCVFLSVCLSACLDGCLDGLMDGCIYVVLYSSSLCSTQSLLAFLKWNGLIWPLGGSSKQKPIHLFCAICKVWLYKSIRENSSRQMPQIVALPP